MQVILAEQRGQNRLRKRDFLLLATAVATAAFWEIRPVVGIGALTDLVAVGVAIPIRVRVVGIRTQVRLVGIAQAVAVHVIITPTSASTAIATPSVTTPFNRKVLHPKRVDLTRLVTNQVEYECIKGIGRHGPAPNSKRLLQFQEYRFVFLKFGIVVDGNRELLDQRIAAFPNQPIGRLEEWIDAVECPDRAGVIGQRVNLVRLLLRKIFDIDRIGSSLELFPVAEPILIRIRIVGIGTIYCLFIICQTIPIGVCWNYRETTWVRWICPCVNLVPIVVTVLIRIG